MAPARISLAMRRSGSVENKPGKMTCNTFGLTPVALYSPTTGDNALRKGRDLPPKNDGKMRLRPEAMDRNCGWCVRFLTRELLQLLVLCAGLFQNRDVSIGIPPARGNRGKQLSLPPGRLRAHISGVKLMAKPQVCIISVEPTHWWIS